MNIKFAFNEGKAVAALAFVAREHPGFTPLFVSKVFFFAEKWHLNKYGRPIVADTYIAMTNGPVPSTIKNYIDGKWDWVAPPANLNDVITIERGRGLPKLMPGKQAANMDVLSPSDIESLKAAIDFCATKEDDELSQITHFEKAWKLAEANRPMDYANFVDDDNPQREAVLAAAEENAAYGIL
jgi:hypothetical protein